MMPGIDTHLDAPRFLKSSRSAKDFWVKITVGIHELKQFKRDMNSVGAENGNDQDREDEDWRAANLVNTRTMALT
jgi:hypothetical protein